MHKYLRTHTEKHIHRAHSFALAPSTSGAKALRPESGQGHDVCLLTCFSRLDCGKLISFLLNIRVCNGSQMPENPMLLVHGWSGQLLLIATNTSTSLTGSHSTEIGGRKLGALIFRESH